METAGARIGMKVTQDQASSDLFRGLIRPHRVRIVLALVLNSVVGAAVAFQNVVPKFLIDDALLKEGIGPEERKLRLLLFTGLYVVIGIVARALVWNLSLRIFCQVRESCLFQLRSTFFRHVNRLCFSFHARHHSGELFSYLLGSPLQHIQQYFQQMTLMVPSQLVGLVLTLVFLGAWDVGLSLLTVLILGVFYAVMQQARIRMRAIHKDYQNTESQVSGKVADLLRGHRTVKMHAFEEQAKRDFEQGANRIREQSVFRDVTQHMQQVKQESVLYIGYALLCVAAGFRYLEGGLTEGQLTAYLTSFIALKGPLGTFFQVALLRGAAQASLSRISCVLQERSTTPDPEENPEPVPETAGIRFRDVEFGYEPGRPVLRNLNLEIPYGQNVALVGSSGAGKSTLVQLLLRLYDPDGGGVELDGVDLRRMIGQDLRRHFGVVPQDPYFFTASVRDNLHVAAPDADSGTLEQACREANAWEFVERMPKGLDTLIGENGTSLSGGQKQRLAIARALLARPSYFVFDEATSALDTVSEGLIRDAVARVTKGRTSLFIAHRLASVTHCDRILVIGDGQVIQDGTFEDLSKCEGPFRELLRSQNLSAET